MFRKFGSKGVLLIVILALAAVVGVSTGTDAAIRAAIKWQAVSGDFNDLMASFAFFTLSDWQSETDRIFSVDVTNDDTKDANIFIKAIIKRGTQQTWTAEIVTKNIMVKAGATRTISNFDINERTELYNYRYDVKFLNSETVNQILTSGSLPIGVYTITLEVYEVGKSTPIKTSSIDLEVTQPGGPKISYPRDGTELPDAFPTVKWSLPDIPARATMASTVVLSEGSNIVHTETINHPDFNNGGTYEYRWDNSKPALKPGKSYKLTVTLKDGHNRQIGEPAIISFTLYNEAPTASITSVSPDLTQYYVGDQVALLGTGSDREDSQSALKLEWTIEGKTYSGTQAVHKFISSGSITATLKVTDSLGRNNTATKSFNVAANQGPTTIITSPANQAVFVAGEPINFKCTTNDPEGHSITEIAWYDNTTKIGSSCDFSTSSLAAGSHTIHVSTKDARGSWGSSAQVSVTVNKQLSVTVALNPNDTVYNPGQQIRVDANASGGIGSYTYTWYDGSSELAQGDSASYSSTAFSVGTHSISVKAKDNQGRAAQSGTVSFRINAQPTAKITSPVEDQVYSVGDSVQLTAEVNDPDNDRLNYVWTVDTSRLSQNAGSVTAPRLAVGKHEVRLTVTDAADGSVSIEPVGFYVNAIPVVTLTSPAVAARTLMQGDKLGVAVSVTDAGDSVAEVKWLIEGNVVATSSGTTYTLDTASLSVGLHNLSAQVVDAHEGVGNAPAVSIEIKAPLSQTVTRNSAAVVNPGDEVSFSADVQGGIQPYTYTWRVDGTVQSTTKSYNSRTLKGGVHDIQFTAKDTAGHTVTSVVYSIRVNTPPTVSVTPPQSTLVLKGTDISLTAQYDDLDSVTVSWLLDGAPLTSVGAGITLKTDELKAGDHTIVARATDVLGLYTDSAPVKFLVNAAPTVKIVSPTEAMFIYNTPIQFAAEAIDPSDTVTYTWQLDSLPAIRAQIFTTPSASVPRMAVGKHTATVTVTDSHGEKATASVAVTISSEVLASILEPVSGFKVQEGQPVTLRGAAVSPLGGLITYKWISNLDNVIATTLTASPVLSVGTHSIYFTAADAAATDTTDPVTVIVNGRPTVKISSSVIEKKRAVGDTVVLTAEAKDPEGRSLTLTWQVNGSAVSSPYTFSQSGTNTITVRADDGEGGVGTDTVQVAVNAALSASLSISGTTDNGVVNPNANVIARMQAQGGIGDYRYEWIVNDKHTVGTDQLQLDTAKPISYRISGIVRDTAGHEVGVNTLSFRVNDQPTVKIEGLSASVVAAGTPVTLVANITDADQNATDFQTNWFVDNAAKAQGTQLSLPDLPVGLHQIRVEVRDPYNLQSTAEVSVVVNTAPRLVFQQPLQTVFLLNKPVQLGVVASDEPGDSVTISWTVGDKQQTGPVFNVPELPFGTHQVIVVAKDQHNASAELRLTIQVTSNVTVMMLSPAKPGTVVQQGNPVQLSASTASPAPGTPTVTWSSNLGTSNGQKNLGSGANLQVSNLVAGTHTITATAVDSLNATATATTTLIVNAQPTVSITSPLATDTFMVGDSVTLTATSTDPDGKPDALKYTWTIGGQQVADTATASYTFSKSGTQMLRVKVDDAQGGSTFTEMSMAVNSVLQVRGSGSVGAVLNPDDQARFTVSINGGVAPYTYAWTVDSARSTSSGPDLDLSVKNLRSGEHGVSVLVTDSKNHTGTWGPVTFRVNDQPKVTVTAPTNGQSFKYGQPVTLTAKFEDTDSARDYKWIVDGSSIGNGASLRLTNIKPGQHDVELSATDAYGLEGVAPRVRFNVTNAPPKPTIVAPVVHLAVYGRPVTFQVAVIDEEPATVTYKWFVDGRQESGATKDTFIFSKLPLGVHKVSVTTTDPFGDSDSAEIEVECVSHLSAGIVLPKDNAVFKENDPVALLASAQSSTEGEMKYQWSSSVTGNLGTGEYLNLDSLVPGTHQISVNVTDAAGATVTPKSVRITINRKPTAVISSPVPNANVTGGESVSLAATGSDPESDPLTFRWLINGKEIGTGATLPYTFPLVETATPFTVSLQAVDPSGNVSETVSNRVTVLPKLVARIDGLENGTVVNPQARLAATAWVGGASGTVRYTWYVDAVESGNNPQLNVAGATLAAGNHSVLLHVTDGAGRAVDSPSVSIRVNDTPQVSINSPLPGQVIRQGTAVMFKALGTDTDNLTYSWLVDQRTIQEAEFSISNLDPGRHSVKAMVKDAYGVEAETAPITFLVNQLPTVRIVAPTESVYPASVSQVLFRAEVTDTDDTATYEWYDGTTKVGSGATYTMAPPTVGVHGVKVIATDSHGEKAEATMTMNITNEVRAEITSPRTGSVVQLGASTMLSGSAYSTTPGNIRYTWTSSLDGPLGTGKDLLVPRLSRGKHSITLTATDSRGDSVTTEAITLTVNGAPQVEITEPTNTITVMVNDEITLNAKVTDADVANLVLNWAADGVNLGSTTTVKAQFATAGTRTVTFSANDGLGGSASQSVQVVVQPKLSISARLINSPAPFYVAGIPLNFAVDVSGGVAPYTYYWNATTDSGLQTVGNQSTLSFTPVAGKLQMDVLVTDSLNHNVGVVAVKTQIVPSPAVQIVSPAPGAVLTGSGVHLEAQATQGTAPFNYSWTLNESSQLISGQVLDLANWPYGPHTAKVTVTDANNLRSMQSVSFVLNKQPEVNFIAGPTTFVLGSNVQLEAAVRDSGEVPTLTWTVNGVLQSTPDQPKLLLPNPALGTYDIVVTAVDQYGISATASTQVQVKEQLAVNITSPINDAVALETTNVHLEAKTTGGNDLPVTFTWLSSLQGSLGTEAIIDLTNMAAGTHLITVTANQGDLKVTSIPTRLLVNKAPQITSVIPVQDQTIPAETPTIASAVVVDEGVVTYAWTLKDTNVPIGTEATYTLQDLQPGVYCLSLTVTDEHGAKATAENTFRINKTPVLTVAGPKAESHTVSGVPISFKAQAQDTPGDTLTWIWLIDGQPAQTLAGYMGPNAVGPGDATNFNVRSLSVGEHQVTAQVTDNYGAKAEANFTIYVDSFVVVNIVKPTEVKFNEGQLVSFYATAHGPFANTISYEWESSPQGVLGAGQGVVTALKPGKHTITVKATDSTGVFGTANVDVYINSKPTVKITYPAPDFVFGFHSPVLLMALGADPDKDTLVYTWQEEGNPQPLGSGSTLSVTNLKTGPHTATVTVRDPAGLTATSEPIRFKVDKPDPGELKIVSPTPGQRFADNAADINATISIKQPEGGNLPLDKITWILDGKPISAPSRLDGSRTLGRLGLGSHTLRVEGIDTPYGYAYKAEVKFTVYPTKPITILQPAPNSVWNGGSIPLSGQAFDMDGNPVPWFRLRWGLNNRCNIGYGNGSFTLAAVADRCLNVGAVNTLHLYVEGAPELGIASVNVPIFFSFPPNFFYGNNWKITGGTNNQYRVSIDRKYLPDFKKALVAAFAKWRAVSFRYNFTVVDRKTGVFLEYIRLPY